MNKGSFNELEYWKRQLREGIHSKATKDYILQQLREAANADGVPVPAYNSNEFREFLNAKPE